MHRLLHRAVLAAFRVGEEAPGAEALDDRGVVLVGGQHAVAVHLVGVLDHAEQRLVLALAVDVPAGIEDLVAAVLGVGLGEHHQFDVVRVAPQVVEALDQVVDLVLGQCQTEVLVGLLQRRTATTEDVHGGQRLGLGMAEQCRSVLEGAQHQLGHAVMQQRGDGSAVGLAQLTADVIGDAALQALDLGQATVAGDIAGLARPGRDGAETRNGQEQLAAGFLHSDARAVLEQARQHLLFIGVEYAGDIGEMRELGVQPGHGRHLAGQLLEQFAMAESGKGGSAAQDQHRRYSLWRRGVLRGRAF